MLRTMSSLCVPNFDSAPLSMPKLKPINHFSEVSPLVPGVKLLELKFGGFLSRSCLKVTNNQVRARALKHPPTPPPSPVRLKRGLGIYLGTSPV